MIIFLPPICDKHKGLTKIVDGVITASDHDGLKTEVDAYEIFDGVMPTRCTLATKVVLKNPPDDMYPMRTYTSYYLGYIYTISYHYDGEKDIYHTKVTISTEYYDCCGGGYPDSIQIILSQDSRDYLS